MALASWTTAARRDVVATDRQREAEGEDEAHNAQQRCLQDSERLPQALREVPLPAAEQHPEAGRAEHCCEEDERERRRAEPEEQRRRPQLLPRRETQNPTAVAAPARAPPRSKAKGISELVSMARRPPAARAAILPPCAADVRSVAR